MNRVRWGVLSTARTAQTRTIPGMLAAGNAEVVAIASRDADRARDVAGRFGIAAAYGTYEELLADPGVDAVYVPLPNQLHVDWTLKAVDTGKHVLCEKPMGMTAADVARLRQCPADLCVMEAFMVRFHPQWLRVRALVRDGTLGDVRAMQALFTYNNPDPANIRNKPETGGGAVLDLACYAVALARFVFDAEPVRALALIDRDPGFQTDRLSSALLDFGSGRQLTLTVGGRLARGQRVEILGDRARLEVEVPLNPPTDQPARLHLSDGAGLARDALTTESVPAADQFALMTEAFGRAVLGEAPLEYGVDDAVRNMAVLDALLRSERTGHWEEPVAGQVPARGPG